MQEIQKILTDNLGNRLTNELATGMFSMIVFHINRMVDEAVKKAKDEACAGTLNDVAGKSDKAE